MESIRWGILGTGRIAATFAAALDSLPDAELAAVGSRSPEAAAEFARCTGAARSHGSYADLAADPEIDVVYIATPHALHHANVRLCLEAGKGVLCEKPFTLNAAQARDLIALARERQLFLMEAMWSRCLPALVEAKRLVDAGTLGEPRVLLADFGFHKPFDAAHRLYDPTLGGGALLDVGVYLLSLASMFFGPPTTVHSRARIGDSGVDEECALLLGYDERRSAQLTAAISATTPQEATIVGSAGWLRLHAPWWKAASFSVVRDGQEPEVIAAPYEGNGYTHEALEVMRCLRAGELESPHLPLDETLAILELMDRVRAEWGLRYPGE